MSSIQFSPFTAIFENRAAGTVIIGAPGSGKTFMVLNLISNCRLMEQRIFAIDPKNDLGAITDVYPDIEYVDVNSIKPGALNIFKAIENIDTSTIVSIISIICGGLSDSQLVSITPIVNDFVIAYRKDPDSNVSFSNLTEYLYANDNEDARTIGTMLSIHRDSEYGPLIFDCEEGTEVLEMNENSKVISFFGMDLPKKLDSKLTEGQKFNSAIIYIICRMLRQLMKKDGYPTLFVMDEAHIAYQNEAFSSIINEVLILGRSLSVATVLASQSITHYPEDIAQLVSSKFCFKSSGKEAKEFLEIFSNPSPDAKSDIDSIVFEIGEFEPGMTLFIDSRNRTGIFKVVSMLSDNISSNPLSRKKKTKSLEGRAKL